LFTIISFYLVLLHVRVDLDDLVGGAPSRLVFRYLLDRVKRQQLIGRVSADDYGHARVRDLLIPFVVDSMY
jgi:hypothetical protein